MSDAISIKVGDTFCDHEVLFSNEAPLSFIAGPCVIESLDHALETASALKEMATSLKVGLVYKSSFDKANRTSGKAYRGVGLKQGIDILERVKQDTGLPVVTDVHSPYQCTAVTNVVDILQIPAFLCRQTDLLEAAAKTGKPLNIKKGQFLAPWDMKNVVQKILDFGNKTPMLCERGASFGYNTLVVDMRSLSIMAQTGYPVIFDATHSVQQPGGEGTKSGGQREFAPVLARAAVAVGVAGVFMEVHENPDQAPSDGPNMIVLKEAQNIMRRLKALDEVAKKPNTALYQHAT